MLDGSGLDYEIVFVDDGSNDRSAEIVRGFRDASPRVRLIRLKANAGETAALDAGFKAARGRWVVSMDADLQNDPHDIPHRLSYLDRWDAVTGGGRSGATAIRSSDACPRGSRTGFATA